MCKKGIMLGGFAGLSVIVFFYVTAVYLPEDCDDNQEED